MNPKIAPPMVQPRPLYGPFDKRDPLELKLNLPRRYETATVASIAHPVIREVARDYCERFEKVARHGIAPLLLGPVQIYKTYASAAVVRWVHHHEQLPTCFVSVPGEMARLERRRFDPDTEQQIEGMKRVSFLVLDDFPLVGAGTFASAMLVEIVSARFDAMLPTMMTGNIVVAEKNTRELDAKFGPQFGRRVYDMSAGFRITATED